ncbi:MAG TPA: hypothetical protein DEO38_03825 [Bacteroidales bacterium]|nr:hypothetical protein [Bacteroidales bacterium]
MSDRTQSASDKKRLGSHNCAQAVISAYGDLVGLTERQCLNLGACYGLGMGNMEGTCGALVGAGAILGLAVQDRAKGREAMKSIMTKFYERNGATQCRKLKGIDTGKVLRQCTDCVADAAELLEAEMAKVQ